MKTCTFSHHAFYQRTPVSLVSPFNRLSAVISRDETAENYEKSSQDRPIMRHGF